MTSPILTISRDSIERMHDSEYVTEASAIGIGPDATWPRLIAVTGWGREALFRFVTSEADVVNGDLVSCTYRTYFGPDATLRIYND
jgi:hypothetical protein